MKNILLVVAGVSFIVANQIYNYSSINTDSFCEFVQELEQKNILDGEVCVIKGDTIVLHECSKELLACAPKGKAQFLIGSLSKQFTAVALLHVLYTTSIGFTEAEKCADVKKQLHKPLSFFLPFDALIWSGAMPAWADEVTLHHLLSHTSGISSFIKIIFDRSGFDGIWQYLSRPHTAAERVSFIVQEPLAFEPGTSYCYSNDGYMLLAEVIEAVSGMPFSRYVENLCNSIGMTDTGHPDFGNWKQIKQEPYYGCLMQELIYSVICTESPLLEPSINMCHDISNVRGAGGIVSTMQDLIRWNNVLHKTENLLPKALYELLIKPNLEGYGYGIINNGVMLWHNGRIDSYSSDMIYVPDEDLLIIVLCHIDHDETMLRTACALEAVLQKIIPNAIERQALGNKFLVDLIEKYPPIRGAELIRKFKIKK